MRKKDFTYPPRNRIKEELLKVSDFTKEEVNNMEYNEFYSAYGKIVRYGLTGVEENFRNKS